VSDVYGPEAPYGVAKCRNYCEVPKNINANKLRMFAPVCFIDFYRIHYNYIYVTILYCTRSTLQIRVYPLEAAVYPHTYVHILKRT
jgi:hypothetical protein